LRRASLLKVIQPIMPSFSAIIFSVEVFMLLLIGARYGLFLSGRVSVHCEAII